MIYRKIPSIIILLFVACLQVFSVTTLSSTQFQIHWNIRNTTQKEAEIGLYSFGTNTALQTTTISLVPAYGEQGICTMYYTTNYMGKSAESPVTHHFSVKVTPLLNTQDSTNKLPVVLYVKRDSVTDLTLETVPVTIEQITTLADAQSTFNVNVVGINLNRVTLLFDFYVDLTKALNSQSMVASAVYSSNITVGVEAP